MRARGAVAPVALVALLAAGAGPVTRSAGTVAPLDPAAWQAAPAAGVAMQLHAASGPDGAPALRIDYDFQGRGGWAAARLPLDVELPPYYEIRFLLRGEGPPNHLELKLVDPSGTNVWWHVKRDLAWPAEWTPMRVRKRQVTFAWGPRGGGEPRRIGALELTVSASSGGRGTLWFAGLEIVATEPAATTPGPLRAAATSAAVEHDAPAAVDGDPATTWRPEAGDEGEITIDLGRLVELGGLTLTWESGRAPRRFAVELSRDGTTWDEVREVTRGGAARSHLRTPDGEARLVRVRLPADAGCPESCGLAEVIVRPLAFGASVDAFLVALAGEAPRGTYPRGFVEAVYWTVTGQPGSAQESLVSEDGAVELGERRLTLEPMLYLGDRLYTWADVTARQSLADGDLPIPTITWEIPAGGASAGGPSLVRLEITALDFNYSENPHLLVHYRLINESPTHLRGRLFVLARPFQVNPPHQFLNISGGVAPIRRIACDAKGLAADDVMVRMGPAPAACGAVAFDEGELRGWLARGEVPPSGSVEDPTALASAAMASEVDLAPGEVRQATISASTRDIGSPLSLQHGGHRMFDFLRQQEEESWRRWLDGVTIDVPDEALPLVRTMRSNLAFIQIHLDSPALQPGSRAYARSWIRDGALTGVALLRLRQKELVAAFAEWFAGYQYADGKVPCCVDRRGADPVPEHDSHGELVHLIAELYRYTGDRDLAERLFPHVAAAVDAIEALRQQRRTSGYEQGPKRLFFGLLPESISHEGYSAKPVHSYWDDTFAYRGLDDAATLAAALGKTALAGSWAMRRDQFRADFLASIERVRVARRLADLPASADLADFDSTSTTTMLDPGGLLPYLPRDAVEATFERFWSELVARRDGRRQWEAYTPYELRHVGSFVRLSLAEPRWKERAHQLLAYYLRDQRPPGWNGWPEAVHRDYRAPRFLGDLPHGWVGSDFIRSLLDLFAFERREDAALVLGAGVPPSWLDRPQGIAVRGVGTPWGPLSYSLARSGNGYRFRVAGGLRVPPGGVVLVPPLRQPGQAATIDGRAVAPGEDGTVVVHDLPAVVEFTVRPHTEAAPGS